MSSTIGNAQLASEYWRRLADVLTHVASLGEIEALSKFEGDYGICTVGPDRIITYANPKIKEATFADVGKTCCESFCDYFREFDCLTISCIQKDYIAIRTDLNTMIGESKEDVTLIRVPVKGVGMLLVWRENEQ